VFSHFFSSFLDDAAQQTTSFPSIFLTSSSNMMIKGLSTIFLHEGYVPEN